jgi:signal transduction histidine kinase
MLSIIDPLEVLFFPKLPLRFPYSRDRNREHAKNTRLRKKAYVMKLKELLDQMDRQKEIEEKERRALGERIHDTVSFMNNFILVSSEALAVF